MLSGRRQLEVLTQEIKFNHRRYFALTGMDASETDTIFVCERVRLIVRENKGAQMTSKDPFAIRATIITCKEDHYRFDLSFNSLSDTLYYQFAC